MLSLSLQLSAQETMVVGQVISASDKIPIEQVNIRFKNSNSYTQTDKEGFFLIKTTEKQTTLSVTCIGYKSREIKIRYGQSVGIDIELEEESTMLQEVFVLPGTNPALQLMKKVQFLAKQNDQTRQKEFTAQSTEQNLVLLNKITERTFSKRIFNQLKTGSISKLDSSLIVPLYISENKYNLTQKAKVEQSKKIFSSAEIGEKILEKLVGALSSELNFYNSTVTIFGQSMISPLASVGNLFYNYYLIDSIPTKNGKQYEVEFRTRNTKNLAFNGKLWVDSASFALTKIEAELPNKANINFIRNLSISEDFCFQPNSGWACKSEEMTLNLNYVLLADSLNTKPELFIKRSASYQYKEDSIAKMKNFANSQYSLETLDSKLSYLNNTPILRTAKWIADVMLTGYMNMGKIDMGKVQQIIRITDVEGFRLTLPFRTNENLWKKLSLGGYIGYGFKNRILNYSGMAQWQLPGTGRKILGVNYCNDYRQIDYNYNDNIYRENPLVTGDADISSTFFANRSESKVNERKELSLSFNNDWSSDIESKWTFRSNKILPNDWLPLSDGNGMKSLITQSANVLTRFSKNEKNYDDHLQRIYIDNYNPVIYSLLETGNFKLGTTSGQYAKASAAVKQTVLLPIGQFRYLAEAGCVFGTVPYPLLASPAGTESGGYGLYQFSLLGYNEFSSDKYINIQSELTLNGLFLNNIPLIKVLNLRELFSLKMAYGSLRDSNRNSIINKGIVQAFKTPYLEVGIGLTNIFHILSVQWIFQIANFQNPIIDNSGIRLALSLSF